MSELRKEIRAAMNGPSDQAIEAAAQAAWNSTGGVAWDKAISDERYALTVRKFRAEQQAGLTAAYAIDFPLATVDAAQANEEEV